MPVKKNTKKPINKSLDLKTRNKVTKDNRFQWDVLVLYAIALQ